MASAQRLEPSAAPLKIRGLHVEAFSAGRTHPLLIDVDLDLAPGEILGVVGESGSGKSTLCRAIARILAPRVRVSAGSVRLGERDLLVGSPSSAHRLRPGGVGMIFQEPRAALNPVMRVGDQIVEALRHSTGERRAGARAGAVELLEALGLPDAEQRMSDYPHQFSGGQCQRLVTAIALAGAPGLLVADEPTSALDVTTQAQILELLRGIVAGRGVSMLLVSHNYAVVAQLCDRVAVMYGGRIVEIAPTATLLSNPRHPYTAALLSALPDVDRRTERLAVIPGRAAPAGALPTGCPFRERCAYAQPRCAEPGISLVPCGDEHACACVRMDELCLPAVLAA